MDLCNRFFLPNCLEVAVIVALNISCKVFIFFIPAMCIGIVDFYHYKWAWLWLGVTRSEQSETSWLLSGTVFSEWGWNFVWCGSNSSWTPWCYVWVAFNEIWKILGEVAVISLPLNLIYWDVRLLFCWLHQTGWLAFGCYWSHLILTWYDDTYHCTLHFDTNLNWLTLIQGRRSVTKQSILPKISREVLTLFIQRNFKGINLSGPSNFLCWQKNCCSHKNKLEKKFLSPSNFVWM